MNVLLHEPAVTKPAEEGKKKVRVAQKGVKGEENVWSLHEILFLEKPLANVLRVHPDFPRTAAARVRCRSDTVTLSKTLTFLMCVCFFFKGVIFDAGYSLAPHAKTNQLPAGQRVPVVAGTVITHVCFFFFLWFSFHPSDLQLSQHFGRLRRRQLRRSKSARAAAVGRLLTRVNVSAQPTPHGKHRAGERHTVTHTHTRARDVAAGPAL